MVLKLSPPQYTVFDDAVFDATLDYGLNQDAVIETATQTESPKVGMVACNACNKKQPEKYFMSQACRVTSTKLHWLRQQLP